MNQRTTDLITAMDRSFEAHGLAVRCPACRAGVGKWCVGTERLAGPTDPHPSHQARLIR